MKTKYSKSNILICIILIISFSLSAQQKELKVLFVGNSYTYNSNLPHIVSILSEGTSTKLVTRRSVAGGAYLYEHWNSKKGLKTREIIRNGDFDVVVLQDNSMATINVPDSTIKYINKFTEFNRKYGAETFLFNTWAREKVPQYQETIDKIYIQGATESGATRVPVGSAWQLAIDIRPSIDLYNSDGSHPTQLGTVLIASMFVKALTGELPENYPIEFNVTDEFGENVNLLWVDALDAEFCKRIAGEILKD